MNFIHDVVVTNLINEKVTAEAFNNEKILFDPFNKALISLCFKLMIPWYTPRTGMSGLKNQVS